MEELAQKAVLKALSGEWGEALKINLQIIKKDPQNKNNFTVDALNRAAKACARLGYLEKAKKFSREVLVMDPMNSIAGKALEKWEGLESTENIDGHASLPPAHHFLEEPGKTKIVPLLNLGDQRLIAQIDSGCEVKLSAHSHKVSIITLDGKYVGRLPDDLAAHLKRLIELGNCYKVLVKSVDKSEVKVFIKELIRSDAVKYVTSFPLERTNYVSFTPPELVQRKSKRLYVKSVLQNFPQF